MLDACGARATPHLHGTVGATGQHEAIALEVEFGPGRVAQQGGEDGLAIEQGFKRHCAFIFRWVVVYPSYRTDAFPSSAHTHRRMRWGWRGLWQAVGAHPTGRADPLRAAALDGGASGCYSTAMTASTPVPLATLEAVLERITYANEENGYTVARVAVRGSADLTTVVGNLLGAQPGESLRMRGVWKSHPQFGRQFEVRDYK